jgi:hypothetical protein
VDAPNDSLPLGHWSLYAVGFRPILLAMTIEFLDSHATGSRPAYAQLLPLVSGLLGFMLGFAPLIATLPLHDQPQGALPIAAPSRQLSDVERGRQADAARLQGLSDRWVSEGCRLIDPRNLGSAETP